MKADFSVFLHFCCLKSVCSSSRPVLKKFNNGPFYVHALFLHCSLELSSYYSRTSLAQFYFLEHFKSSLCGVDTKFLLFFRVFYV